MIISFTPNPSLDRTAPLAGAVRSGQVNRLGDVSTQAAGKGVNLSAAVHAAGHPTLAIVPVDAEDPLADALRERRVPSRNVPVGHRARHNLTIVHADGSTTKINEPGEALTRENVTALASAVMATLPGASWLALCGSLPPGAPVDWYTKLLQRAHEVGVRVAVDANGPALEAVLAGMPEFVPDVISPNVPELEEATGIDIAGALADGDLGPALRAARLLVSLRCPAVLATLGAKGALLVTADAAWHASAAPVAVVSAISSGDAALAGYLLAQVGGAAPEECLRRAVAYGTAAVQLPGSEVPEPHEADAVDVQVVPLR